MVFRFHRSSFSSIPVSSLEVRMTAAKGWGLFTKKALTPKHGIEVIGEVISVWEEDEREMAYLQTNACFLFPKYHPHDRLRVYAIDNKHVGNLTHFINHSCAPNLSIEMVNDGRQVALVPTRKIEPDEELTIAYDLDKFPRATLVCQCGEQRCSGQLI
jgi:histone-lysine N-methyltransferase SUV39H